MTKPLPLEVLLSREITKNRTRIMREVDLGLVYVTQGLKAAQKRALDVYQKRYKSEGTWGGSRQAFTILGIDPFNANEMQSLLELDDRIIEDHFRYPTTMWKYYCKGYVSFNELAECREKTHDKQGERKHFYSEGLAYIEAYFIKLVKERGYKPATSCKLQKKLHHVDEIQESNEPINYVHDKVEIDSIKTIESYVLDKQLSFEEEDDELVFPEGKEVHRLHRSKERNKAVIDLAKKKGKDRDPLLCCSVCDFSFSKVYGVIGEDFIEAHHTKPLSEITEEVETKVEDIALVCSNCHRMLHRKRPWLSISDLQAILKSK